jgi:hypothetical protein
MLLELPLSICYDSLLTIYLHGIDGSDILQTYLSGRKCFVWALFAYRHWNCASVLLICVVGFYNTCFLASHCRTLSSCVYIFYLDDSFEVDWLYSTLHGIALP